MKTLIDIKEFLINYNSLLDNPLALLMYCVFRKKENVVLCNINSVPHNISLDDVIKFADGKYVKL